MATPIDFSDLGTIESPSDFSDLGVIEPSVNSPPIKPVDFSDLGVIEQPPAARIDPPGFIIPNAGRTLRMSPDVIGGTPKTTLPSGPVASPLEDLDPGISQTILGAIGLGGRAMGRGGKAIAATVGDIASVPASIAGYTPLLQNLSAFASEPWGGEIDEQGNWKEADKPLPIEERANQSGRVSRFAMKVGIGAARMEPQLAAGFGLGALGVPASLAASLPMLATPQGEIDPVGAAIAAGLPGASHLGETAVSAILTKIPVTKVLLQAIGGDPLRLKGAVVQKLGGVEISNDQFRKFLEAGGGFTAANAYLLAAQSPALAALPENQRADAALDIIAGNIAPSLLGFVRPGLSKTLETVGPEIAKNPDFLAALAQAREPQPKGPNATSTGQQQGQPGSQYPGVVPQQPVEASGQAPIAGADIGNRPANPAGQPPERPNAPAQAEHKEILYPSESLNFRGGEATSWSEVSSVSKNYNDDGKTIYVIGYGGKDANGRTEFVGFSDNPIWETHPSYAGESKYIIGKKPAAPAQITQTPIVPSAEPRATAAAVQPTNIPVSGEPNAPPPPVPETPVLGGAEANLPAQQREQSRRNNEAQVDQMRAELEAMGVTVPQKAVPKAETPKSSTQLTLPPTEAAPFIQFAQSIPANEVYHKADETGKDDFGIETTPHITVLYGLTKHEPSIVVPAVASKQPITVTLGKLSTFKSKDYDVLKVDVQSDDLHALNKEIAKLPNEQTFSKYTPHLTIAYLKKGEGEKYVGDKRFEGMKLTFPSVTFSPPSEIRAKTGVTEIPFTKGGESPNANKRISQEKEKGQRQGHGLVPPAVAGAASAPVAPLPDLPTWRGLDHTVQRTGKDSRYVPATGERTLWPGVTSKRQVVDMQWYAERLKRGEITAEEFAKTIRGIGENPMYGRGRTVQRPVAAVTPPPAEVSPIGDKPPAPSEPLDTLGNPESFYATKSLMGAQMRRSPKLAAAMKFYSAKTIKRLNELATRRFAEMRERATAAAPAPIPVPESKPKSPKAEKEKPSRDDSKEFERLVLEHGAQAGWVANFEALYDPMLEVKTGTGTAVIKAKILKSKAMQAARNRAAEDLGFTSNEVDTPQGRAAMLPKLREHIANNFPAAAQQETNFQKAIASGKQAVAVGELQIGDALDVEGETVTVTEIDPDTHDVTLEDGRRFGTQVLRDGTRLYAESWSKAASETEALLAPPESVEEQTARLAAEADRADKAKTQRQKEEREATKIREAKAQAARRLGGDLGSAGQGGLFAEPGQQEIFTPPPPKSQSSLGAAVAKPMTQSAVESVVREFFGGEIPANVRFVNDPNAPRGLVEMTPGARAQITLNLAKLDTPELVRDTLREELVHAVWDSPAVADARRTIEGLISDVDRERQAEEGYNPNETAEEAANERARRINDDAEKANIFVRAWRAIVEAIKKLFGVKLNANETARAAARTIMREARRNEPTERGGAMGAEPTPAEKAVLESDAFKRNLSLADELGKIVPEEGETGVPTKVGNVEDMVLTRPGLNAAVREDSVSAAASALREAGLNIVRHADGLWDLADRVTPQDMAGNALVPILEREIQATRASNRPERIANLLNTVVVHLARDGNGAFSQTVKDQLYALAQSERSAYGRALGGLAMWGNVLANIAQSPSLHLHRIYSKAVGGPEIEGVIKKLLTVFRDFFSPEEIRTALNPLDLNETARRLIQLKDRDTGSRVYRQVQQRLRGTPPKTTEQKNRRAVEDDAIESLIRQAADLGHIEPPKPKNQKLTADEQLKLLSNPAVAAKVQEATEVAVQNAEFNAGWKAEANAAKGDPEAAADVAERKALGEDPSPEMIEEGLNLPEYAHWRDIRDNFLNYSPTTLKVVQDVVKGRFRGARFGVAEPKPADLRIDFKKLATNPDVEVQRVFDAQVAAVQGLMDKATPATVARLSAVFLQNIEDQLARHRKETVDKLFKEQATGKESPTAIEALKQKINAGLLRDQRLSDAEMAQRAADKSALRDVLPSVSELVERIVASPRYKMADIKTDVAAALVKELGLTDEAAANLSDLVYRALDGTDAKPGPLREASRKALEQVQTALSPADRKILFKKHVMAVNDIRGRKPGRTLWELIERGARAGLFDPTPVLETMARAIGFKVPTAEEKARMKSWAEEEIRLRTPTQRQIDAQQGTAEEKLAKATRAAEAGTESDRLDLIRKIQANWSRWSMPIGLRNFLDPTIARNNAKAVNEFVAANLLAKAGFFFRQGLDVGLVSMPLNAANRALAHVLERAQNDGGFTAATVKDLDAATKEMVTARIASFKATLIAAGRTATGHTNRKVLDRMNHSVGVFDRMRVMADDLEAKGNLAGARALRVATLLQIGYRVAMTWDTIQSVGLEWQEMRQQLSTDLRRAGKTHAEIATTLDDVFGSIKLDMAEAVAEANAIAAERGLTKTKGAIQADAWGLIRAKAYDRMRTAAGTTTDYEAENEQFKELHSWNIPETGGVGGVIAETIKVIKKNTEKAGIPTGGLFSFGNAMGIAANRMLTFSGGGLFGGFGFGDSPWFKGERNKRQRRLEAMEGLAAIALVIALAAAGKLIIQTKYPKDKDEKEKFIADGHKLNTLRWQNDDGTWLEYPIQMAPFGFIASPLYMVGGVQQLLTDQRRAQARLDAEAARTGKVAGKAKAIDAGDVMSVLAQGAYGMLTGGRTASGAIQSFTDYGNFNLNRAVSGLVSPYIPGLPAWQEVARAMGATMDTRMASVLELLVPTPWSGHQRVNSLGDPLNNPNAVTRLVQVMSGGIGWGDGALPSDQPYRTLVQSGYAPPDINPNKGYDFGGTIRPMTGSELEAYTVARGEAFKQELSGVNVDGLAEPEARKAVQAAYQRANRTALASVGVTVPASASRATAGEASSSAQTPAVGPAAARGLAVPRGTSRFGAARGSATLRFARKPSSGVRLPSRRGSLRLGFRRGPTVRRRGTLRLPARGGSLRLRRPRLA